MQDFPGNSAKARVRSEGPQPSGRPERIERITSAEADRRKVGVGRRFKETVIHGDARMAADYALTDIIIPAIRDLMFDAIQGSLDRWIYGESRRGFRRGGGGFSQTPTYPNGAPRVDYGSYSSGRPPTSSPRMLSRQSRTRHDFDEIVIYSRAEAEEVLERMYEFIERYGMVTVYELYAMTGIAASHTDHKWGWTSLRNAKIIRQRNGGFLLDLPEPEALSA